MTDLRFITDERLRHLVERDKEELDSCHENQLCKSTLLLAGSIIEAILVDFFLAFPRSNTTPTQVLGANLADLIDWAEQEGIVTARTRELSTVIRNYRNLIHPGREYRLRERVDKHTAAVATNLVEIIIMEIADSYAKRLGYTAEQAIQKVKLDPSGSAIFKHMIERMATTEKIKLFRAIPDECRGYEVSTVVESLIHLHDLLKTAIPQDVARAQAAKVYTYIHSSSQAVAMFYFRFFVNNLDMLEDEQRKAVIVYLLGILEHGSQEELELYEKWKIFSALGEQLNNEEGVAQLKEVLYSQSSETSDTKFKAFLHALSDILSELNSDYQESLKSEIRGADPWDIGHRKDELVDYIEISKLPF